VPIAGGANALQLFVLTLSSVLLYMAGIVFNDYFDIKIDLIERPYRPLPSKSITTKKAMLIAVISMVSGNILAFVVGTSSLVVCIILSSMIIGYDYRLKNTLLGPVVMGLTRSLNCILGASPALFVISINSFVDANNILARLIFVSLSLFVYILAISLLSRNEVPSAGEQQGRAIKQSVTKETRQLRTVSFLLVFSIIVSIILAIFFAILKIELFVCLILFAVIIVITFKQTDLRDSLTIQNAVKHMVILIICLDSIFITGITGSYYGLLTLLLIPPSMILARKLYVT
jgi:4-hydroxybenzoate polyprenyltransferase